MGELSAVLVHSEACIKIALRMRAIFETKPLTKEKVAAHALFCRCIDHFRASVSIAENGLDPEALALVRGISETTFVIGALLKGVLSIGQLESFDRASKAKGARAMREFLQRNAPTELQMHMSDYADRYAGQTLNFEDLARKIGEADMYNGYYRLFSSLAAHPSLSAIDKYLVYGEHETTINYPGHGRSPQATILIAASAFVHTCAGIERWLGTTPEINQSLNCLLIAHESFGPMSDW